MKRDKIKTFLELAILGLFAYSGTTRIIEYTDYENIYLYASRIRGFLFLALLLAFTCLFGLVKKKKLYYFFGFATGLLYSYTIYDILRYRTVSTSLQRGFYFWIGTFAVMIIDLIVPFNKDLTEEKRVVSPIKLRKKYIRGIYISGIEKHPEYSKAPCGISINAKSIHLFVRSSFECTIIIPKSNILSLNVEPIFQENKIIKGKCSAEDDIKIADHFNSFSKVTDEFSEKEKRYRGTTFEIKIVYKNNDRQNYLLLQTDEDAQNYFKDTIFELEKGSVDFK